MSFDYQAILDDVVIPQVTDFGIDVTLQTRTASDDGVNPTFTTTDYAAKAVKTKYKRMEIDGTIIQHSDVLFLVAPTPGLPEPTLIDRLIFGTQTFEVINIEITEPGSTGVLWKVQGRK